MLHAESRIGFRFACRSQRSLSGVAIQYNMNLPQDNVTVGRVKDKADVVIPVATGTRIDN